MSRVRFTLIVEPGEDRDKVGHETGYVALEQNVVAPHDVSVADISVVVLSDH